MIFKDRRDAGQQLAKRLESYKGPNTIILAIPRGGVVIGYEVSKILQVPLDVVIPRKLGAPGQAELAIGAIAGEDVEVLDSRSIEYLGVPRDYIEMEVKKQREEIIRRNQIYREGRHLPSLAGKTVILVDDGVATGYTTIAASRELRKKNPEKLILAVPVAPPETVSRLRQEVDELIILEMPEPFYAVGSWYMRFDQTTDEEVTELLRRSESEV